MCPRTEEIRTFEREGMTEGDVLSPRSGVGRF
ncbi:MAG: hypothetical protein ACI9KE_004301 [Polyangiales bacterium]